MGWWDEMADFDTTTEGNNLIDVFPRTNRATRRHCDHQWKTIGERTACIECGKDRP
jgi:hypothetical protein